MSESKVYILQKDLPDVKAGSEYELIKDSCYMLITDNRTPLSSDIFPIDTVENNPEWFSEKKTPHPEEIKSNDSFQWTDELVQEYAHNTGKAYRDNQNYVSIQTFKQSHTPKPQAENKPDWEIVCVKKNNHIHYGGYREASFESYMKKGYEIHSVKRLSDGEVFSIGDDTVNGKITGFEILGFNRMHIASLPGNYTELCNAKKLPPQPQKEEQRIEVRILPNSVSEFAKKEYMAVEISESVSKEKYPLIKQAIEQVLNSKQ